jgi:hypothetical protein
MMMKNSVERNTTSDGELGKKENVRLVIVAFNEGGLTAKEDFVTDWGFVTSGNSFVALRQRITKQSPGKQCDHRQTTNTCQHLANVRGLKGFGRRIARCWSTPKSCSASTKRNCKKRNSKSSPHSACLHLSCRPPPHRRHSPNRPKHRRKRPRSDPCRLVNEKKYPAGHKPYHR